MEAEQARELALNARLNYWPPHLGVNTDAEKLEYMATRLDEAATSMFINEGLADENASLNEEVNDLKRELEEANAEIYDLTETIKDLQNKINVQGQQENTGR